MLCEHVATGQQREEFAPSREWYQVIYAQLGEYQQHGVTKVANSAARTITYMPEDLPIEEARALAHAKRKARRVHPGRNGGADQPRVCGRLDLRRWLRAGV